MFGLLNNNNNNNNNNYPPGLLSPPLSRVQLEDGAALGLQPAHLKRLDEAAVQRHTWPHIYLRVRERERKTHAHLS